MFQDEFLGIVLGIPLSFMSIWYLSSYLFFLLFKPPSLWYCDSNHNKLIQVCLSTHPLAHLRAHAPPMAQMPYISTKSTVSESAQN